MKTFEKFRSQGQDKDPVQLAQQIKEAGIGIITVGFNQFGEDVIMVVEKSNIRIFTPKNSGARQNRHSRNGLQRHEH